MSAVASELNCTTTVVSEHSHILIYMQAGQLLQVCSVTSQLSMIYVTAYTQQLLAHTKLQKNKKLNVPNNLYITENTHVTTADIQLPNYTRTTAVFFKGNRYKKGMKSSYRV